jgi:hypothetical protein
VINDLHDAAGEHSDALEAWLAARGDDIGPAYDRLIDARRRHRQLDEQACRDSIPPCWLWKLS